jgi:hypothetical protein
MFVEPTRDIAYERRLGLGCVGWVNIDEVIWVRSPNQCGLKSLTGEDDISNDMRHLTNRGLIQDIRLFVMSEGHIVPIGPFAIDASKPGLVQEEEQCCRFGSIFRKVVEEIAHSVVEVLLTLVGLILTNENSQALDKMLGFLLNNRVEVDENRIDVRDIDPTLYLNLRREQA